MQIDDEKGFRIAQSRTVSNAALANKQEFRISEVFVTLDAEVTHNPQLQTQPERDLTYAEGISKPSKAPSTDSRDR